MLMYTYAWLFDETIWIVNIFRNEMIYHNYPRWRPIMYDVSPCYAPKHFGPISLALSERRLIFE
jgi:hypothetical protein